MTLPRLVTLTLLFFAARVGAAESVPFEFSGVLTDGEKPRFALTDKSSRQTTWLELGDEIAGYSIARYESKDETVTLKKGFEEVPLRLIVARAEPAASGVPAASPSPASDVTANAIKNNLRQLVVAARQHQVETGSPSATFSDLVGPNKYIKQLDPVDGENYAGLQFGPGAANLSVTTASGITVAIDTAPTLGVLGSVASSTQPPAATAPVEAAAPTPTGRINTSHVVRDGDTLAKIAEAAGVSEQEIQALNPGVNPSSLKVGQPIRIR